MRARARVMSAPAARHREHGVSRDTASGTDALRRGGHRLTPQRQLVLRVLEQAGHHLTAEAICQQVQVVYPGMSLSTVYRTLELLARLGLVLEARLGGERRVYELAGERGEHTHLICRSCGAIGHPHDIDLRSLRERLTQETGYVGIAMDLVATGLCPACAASKSCPESPSSLDT